MRDYIEKLNDKQREAATYGDGPLLILAGAGSGKTSTMTARIAYLVQERGVDPYNILAVTFTNKAAGEMRERVDSLIGGGSGIWISTFHSTALRMLKKHCEYLGYTRDFVIYDPTDQKSLMKSLVKARNYDEKSFPPKDILHIISKCKENEMDPEDYIRSEGEDYRSSKIYNLYCDYEAALKKNDAMDFDDLVLNAVRLFRKEPEVLRSYQDRFRYIMVDEYQDTNGLQYKFIKLLSAGHGNLCVVGDDDQCIYQWRGANIQNILNFEKDFRGAKVVKLEQNYRSYGNILNAAHSVISHNRGRKAKKLWTTKDGGEKLRYHKAENEHDEAVFIADEIERLRTKPPLQYEAFPQSGQEEGDREAAPGKPPMKGEWDREAAPGLNYRYKDFVILYRVNALSRVFEEVFSRKGVPYRVLGSLRYYDRKEIKDAMAYMRLVQNPSDEVSLLRIINVPKRGIGQKTIERLQEQAGSRGISLFAALGDREILSTLSDKLYNEIRKLSEMIREYHDEKDNLRVSDIYNGILVRSGYLPALEAEKTLEADSRIENLMEFKTVISEYEEETPNITLEDFMERLALMSDIDNHDPNEDAVTLMTLHSAKGLEFPVVFMPAMEEEIFPGRRAHESQGGMEEERRLCYVGITRAKERLYLTAAERRMLYGRTDYTRKSSFLDELDWSLVEEDKTSLPDGGSGVFRNSYTDGYAKKEPFKPFDSLYYARRETKKSAVAASGLIFKEGDRVSHAKFGAGTVLETGTLGDGSTFAKIVFDTDGSEKKLKVALAPLAKL